MIDLPGVAHISQNFLSHLITIGDEQLIRFLAASVKQQGL